MLCDNRKETINPSEVFHEEAIMKRFVILAIEHLQWSQFL